MLPGGPDAEVSSALHQERPPPVGSVSVKFDNGTVTAAVFSTQHECRDIVEESSLSCYMQYLIVLCVVT